MSIYEENIRTITEYFEKGCKKAEDFGIGIEIEHFLLDEYNHSAAYNQVVRVIQSIMTKKDSPYHLEGHLIGFYNDRYSVTLEPAAQFEISINPCKTVEQLVEIYNEFRNVLDSVLFKEKLRLECYGYNPHEKAEDLRLIPKKRYEYMNRYFEKTGTCGKNMMRATASVQVSVDYENEREAVRKYQLACVLSPVLALMMDNTPVFEGEKAQMHLVRTYIWNNVDSDRCALMKGCLDAEFGFRKYAEYIMNIPAILVMDNGTARYTGDEKIKDIYADRIMTKAEVEHILSMVFFDVRLKNYIEIRMADSCDIDRAADYAELIKNIFYNVKCMDVIENYLGNVTERDVAQAKESIIADGINGRIYGKKASDVVEFVRKTALQ